MNRKFKECNRCGKVIYYGNAYVSINRNVEQGEFIIATNNVEITVIDSEEIIALCGSCGNSFNAAIIENIVNSIPTDDSNIRNN